jgi:DNA-binding transcriptional MocR family regulator
MESPAGGLALWVELPRRASTELALAASTHRLVLATGPLFSADRTHANRVRLPLTLPLEAIPEAVERLAAAWADVEAGVAGGATPTSLAL